ncbi:MAG: restriction endonuclease [Alphaproteobacteria bacterium]|nr:restriction endonuclease [Alphaproteobacteria bacterium]
MPDPPNRHSVDLALERIVVNRNRPIETEKLVTQLIEQLIGISGFSVTREAVLSPYGFDIIARRATGAVVGFEVKSGDIPVGASVVDEFRAILRRGARKEQAILISTGGYSSEARRAIDAAPDGAVQFLDLESLGTWATQVLRSIESETLAHNAGRPAAIVELIIGEAIRRLIEAVAHDPEVLHHVEWRQVEQIVAAVLESLGFEVELTRSAKDGGRDVVAWCTEAGTSIRYLIEVKHWTGRSRPGRREVRKLLHVTVSEAATAGVLLSSNGVAASAFEGLAEADLRLLRFGGKDKLEALCRLYGRRSGGLWLPVIESPSLALLEGLLQPS